MCWCVLCNFAVLCAVCSGATDIIHVRGFGLLVSCSTFYGRRSVGYLRPCGSSRCYGCVSGTMVLVMPSGFELLTRSTVWPELKVQVKGHDIPCSGLLLIRESQPEESSLKTSRDHDHDSAIFRGYNLPDDDADGSRMDSIWELDMSAGGSVFDESESQYSAESVLD